MGVGPSLPGSQPTKKETRAERSKGGGSQSGRPAPPSPGKPQLLQHFTWPLMKHKMDRMRSSTNNKTNKVSLVFLAFSLSLKSRKKHLISSKATMKRQGQREGHFLASPRHSLPGQRRGRRRDEAQRPRPSSAVLGCSQEQKQGTLSSTCGGSCVPESLGPSPSKNRRGFQMGRPGGCT